MSPIGRIFIVLNLLLAALFLGWASSTLNTGQSFKQDLADLQTEFDTFKEEKNDELVVLRAEKEALESSKAQLREEKNDLQADKTRLTTENETLRARNNELAANVAGIEATLADYNSRNDKLVQENNKLNSDLNAANQARRDADDEREAALAAQREAEQGLARVEQDVAGMREQVASLEKDNSSLETQLTSLAEYTGVKLSDITSQPLIEAQVYDVHVDPVHDFSLVSLNKGENDQVKRGYTFEIWEGKQYKGQVRVESVQPDMCTAVVVRQVDGTVIKSGDNASTRI